MVEIDNASVYRLCNTWTELSPKISQLFLKPDAGDGRKQPDMTLYPQAIVIKWIDKHPQTFRPRATFNLEPGDNNIKFVPNVGFDVTDLNSP
jgi:hypothetical protein